MHVILSVVVYHCCGISLIYHNRLEGILQDRHWLTHLCDRGVGEWWAQYHYDWSSCHSSRPLINVPHDQWFYISSLHE